MHDASIRDITMPEPHRTKQILSGLINFTKFKEDKNELFLQHQKQTVRFITLCTVNLYSVCDAMALGYAVTGFSAGDPATAGARQSSAGFAAH